MGLLGKNRKALKKDLSERLGDIIDGDKDIQRALDERPELYAKLEQAYKTASEKGKGVKYFAKFIDYVRKPLAFVKLLGNLAGPGTGYLAAGLTRIAELGLFTLPYSVYYGVKGGSIKDIGKVVGLELAKIPIPYGDLANFVPVYGHTAKKYVDHTTKDYFFKAAKRMKEDKDRRLAGGQSLDDVLTEQPVPGEKERKLAPIRTLPVRKRKKKKAA